MPRRMILTDAERPKFLALPTDDDTLIRHWNINDEDHRLLETRRMEMKPGEIGMAQAMQSGCVLRLPPLPHQSSTSSKTFS